MQESDTLVEVDIACRTWLDAHLWRTLLAVSLGGRTGGVRSQLYALPTCRAALGRAASALSGAGFQLAWRHFSPPLPGAGRDRWCASTNLLQHNHRLRAGIASMLDRLDGWYEYIQHHRDQDGERYATRRFVSQAGAPAWLPHAKLRDTRMPSGYGNPSSTYRHDGSGALPPGQSSTTAPIAIIPADTHVVDTSCGECIAAGEEKGG